MLDPRARSALMRLRCRSPRCSKGEPGAAGRRIAREKRVGGGPPLRLEMDGTVF